MGVKSDKVNRESGVRQGSWLGPVLFTIYAVDLFCIIEKHLPDANGFADDHQLYLAFIPLLGTNQTDSVIAMQICITKIRSWIALDSMMLNDIKTEFEIIGSRQQLQRVNIPSIQVGEEQIEPFNSIQNLGVIFDSNLKMDMHITKPCETA